MKEMKKMKKSWFMGGIVFLSLVSLMAMLMPLLYGVTPLNKGSHEIWNNQAIGDSLVSTEYTTINVDSRGKHFLQLVVTGHADSCQLVIYKEYSNYVKSGAFKWSGRTEVDSLDAETDTYTYLPIFGAGYVRFIVKPWGDHSTTGTKIDFILEVK